MKLSLTSLFLGLVVFATHALACASPGEICYEGAPQACECNGGHLMNCVEVIGDSGIHLGWYYLYGINCPKHDGQLQCVDGHCVQ